MTVLRSPSGEALRPDGAHALSDGIRRWPVIDGIPFMRAGREALADEALRHLDRGDRVEALVTLLADQDDWWTGPRAEPDALHRLVRECRVLSLRDAMTLLSWGRVGDYFAHRWSDPTFMAGLALAEAHWRAPATAFELACGIGHHLRAMARSGAAVAGADVVFAKLWIARHWVVPEAELVCFDAAAPWPLADRRFDLVACHDAFYFLEPKPFILDRLRALATDGTLLVGHIHNRDWPNLSAGAAMSAPELAAMFPEASLFDDAELTQALLEQRAPRPAPAEALGAVEAFAVAEGAPPARAVAGRFAAPAPEARVRRNPLYDETGTLGWPSDRYRAEYAPRATYPARSLLPAEMEAGRAPPEALRRRELLDLPERW
ncbi:class I SAM-dependent methyltransferase [Rhizosaccharibacter radicis]|uniref:Class I SAM-dependent methyltransferase n=1 Tax=Rhizosaccharibacter radicis TaxID=2782605 RepID=A0ABT1VW43_9PROT|nr:class I SAM-dependent methyltransferase [Acetobacteraceae bacterium KSS12]